MSSSLKNKKHFSNFYLGSIAGRPAICMGIRLKNEKVFFTFYLGSFASKLAICTVVNVK